VPQTGNKPKRTMSALALESRRANLAKARAAGRDKIYRPTEKRQAASRANLARAIAARKSPGGNAAARLNALSHGLAVKDVAGSVARMGEDPRQYRQHHALFERAFAPQDDDEREYVRCLADASWKRLRFFRAQADWELNRLKKTFRSIASAPRDAKPVAPVNAEPGRPATTPVNAEFTPALSADETLRRAYILSQALGYDLDYLDYIADFQSAIQRQLRRLLLKRSDGRIKFKVFSNLRNVKSEFTESLDQVFERMFKIKKVKPEKR
jgi:hypothetical protein